MAVPFFSPSISFPEKLMCILEDEEKNGQVVSWLPGGQSFIIRNPGRFTKEVLPMLFDRPCSFDSFTRKLYYWGFKKRGGGVECGVAFYNPGFTRGRPPACMHTRTLQRAMRRRTKSMMSAQATGGKRDLATATPNLGDFLRLMQPPAGSSDALCLQAATAQQLSQQAACGIMQDPAESGRMAALAAMQSQPGGRQFVMRGLQEQCINPSTDSYHSSIYAAATSAANASVPHGSFSDSMRSQCAPTQVDGQHGLQMDSAASGENRAFSFNGVSTNPVAEPQFITSANAQAAPTSTTHPPVHNPTRQDMIQQARNPVALDSQTTSTNFAVNSLSQGMHTSGKSDPLEPTAIPHNTTLFAGGDAAAHEGFMFGGKMDSLHANNTMDHTFHANAGSASAQNVWTRQRDLPLNSFLQNESAAFQSFPLPNPVNSGEIGDASNFNPVCDTLATPAERAPAESGLQGGQYSAHNPAA